MSIDDVMLMVFAGFIVVAIVIVVWQVRRKRRLGASTMPASATPGRFDARSDALFKVMFPELQPYFHPEKVVRFVRDRNGRKDVVNGYAWTNPQGFETASALVAMAGGRERIRLLDAAGKQLVEIDYEHQPSGAALRVGRGKLTAVLDVDTNPRVRYWSPEREFKWSRKGGWQFTTPVAERSIDSGREGSRFSSSGDSSSSSSGVAGVAAAGAAAMVAGAGGAFAGGGASDSWDSGAAAADGGDSGGASTTAY